MTIGDSVYEMGAEQAEAVAEIAAEHSGGIYAIERDGSLMLVNEPYSAQRVLEYESNGYRVRYRLR